jgi:hypothetical protein
MFSRLLVILLCLGMIAPRVTMTCCCAEVVHDEICGDGQVAPKCPRCTGNQVTKRSSCDSTKQASRRCDCRQQIESTPPFQLTNRIKIQYSDATLVAVLKVSQQPADSQASESFRESLLLNSSQLCQSTLCVWQC